MVRRAYKNLIKRFLEAYVVANADTIGDAIGAYMALPDAPYVWKLIWYQFARRISLEGLKRAFLAFLADDPFIRQMLTSAFKK